MNHKYVGVFNSPAYLVNLNIPDSISIIKHVDLGTIKMTWYLYFIIVWSSYINSGLFIFSTSMDLSLSTYI